MIATFAIPVILAVMLATLFFDRTSWRHRKRWLRLLAWLLPVAYCAYTAYMASYPYYFPDKIASFHRYVDSLFIFVLPCVLVALGTLIGRWLKRPRSGLIAGWLVALVALAVWVYGSLVGFRQLEVVRVEFASKDLPPAFDGYRIVQFSDLHLGTYALGRQDVLRRIVDSINAQHADLAVFTGDIQNKEPSEIQEFMPLLSTIEAKDGVFTVLGNHDYTMYSNVTDPVDVGRNQGNTEGWQLDMGWQLLKNSHAYVRRDSSRIVIAGMENDGEPGGRFPQNGDINRALYGVKRSDFVVMLEHDPTAWQRKILPHSHAQLTLSGHTHGGQFEILGWSPASLKYRQYNGMYRAGDRALYVTKGLGGVIPFRFGTKPEIVVITLKTSPSSSGGKK